MLEYVPGKFRFPKLVFQGMIDLANKENQDVTIKGTGTFYNVPVIVHPGDKIEEVLKQWQAKLNSFNNPPSRFRTYLYLYQKSHPDLFLWLAILAIISGILMIAINRFILSN